MSMPPTIFAHGLVAASFKVSIPMGPSPNCAILILLMKVWLFPNARIFEVGNSFRKPDVGGKVSYITFGTDADSCRGCAGWLKLRRAISTKPSASLPCLGGATACGHIVMRFRDTVVLSRVAGGRSSAERQRHRRGADERRLSVDRDAIGSGALRRRA